MKTYDMRSRGRSLLRMFPAAALAFTFSAAIVADPPPALDGMYPQMGETLYLLDSCRNQCPTTTLPHTHVHRVLLDEANAVATLVEVGISFDMRQIDAAGTTPDGKRLYMVSKIGGTGDGNGRFGYMDLVTGEFKNPNGTLVYPLPDPNAQFVTNPGGTAVSELVLGAFSPDGTFYVGSQTTNLVYRLDVVTGIATPLSTIAVAGQPINLSGADFAFSADGRMILWTNSAGSGASSGLYEVFLGPPLVATYLGGGSPSSVTGLAFRANGFVDFPGEFPTDPLIGKVVGSTVSSEVVEFHVDASPSLIHVVQPPYGMFCGCGGAYQYTFGDMTTGPLGYFPCVRSMGYWKNQPWEYVADFPASVELCGEFISQDIGQSLLRQAKAKNASMLAAQLMAAKLNAGGAGVPIIAEAEEFFCDTLGGDFFATFDDRDQKATANYYKEVLETFSTGSAISHHCD